MNSSTTCMREVHICISALAWELCCRHNWLVRRVRIYRRVVFAGRCKRQLAFAHFQQRGHGPGLLGCRRYSRRESGMFSNSLVSYFSTSHVYSTSMCQGSDTLRALGMMMYVCMHTKGGRNSHRARFTSILVWSFHTGSRTCLPSSGYARALTTVIS